MYITTQPTARQQFSRLLFIDEPTFNALQSKTTDVHQIATEITTNASQAFSVLTSASVRELNDVLHFALFDTPSGIFESSTLSKTDETYVKSTVKKFLSTPSDVVGSVAVGDEPVHEAKYCDLIPLPAANELRLMVVVKAGFFDAVTENKEALTAFLLNCLSSLYKYGADLAPLLRLYLRLKFNEGYFDLVKLRFAR